MRALLLARASTWAAHAFGGQARLIAGGAPAAARVADTGVLVAIRPELPAWRPELAAEVRGDLEAGCALSVGPMFDGDLYLLAVAAPAADRLAALTARELAAPGALSRLLALARAEGWTVGLLRAERGLRRARDVRALLADPLTDPELRALLETDSWGGGT